jgi:hypothetical protein
LIYCSYAKASSDKVILQVMFSLLNQPLRDEINELSSEDKVVCVFRGFPSSVLDELNATDHLKWPLAETQAYKNDKLIVDELMSNDVRRSVINTLFSNDRCVIITNEEALAIGESLKISGRKILCFNNDLIDEYINETDRVLN